VKTILIGSPIKQKSAILSLFLDSLRQLSSSALQVDFYFVDDNHDLASSELLWQFKNEYPNTIIVPANSVDEYRCDDYTHYWTKSLVWKVAAYKNAIIQHSKLNNYDYLFLIDSDILLQPNTINHLVEQKKDIISEIFWTKFKPDSISTPQVWLYDEFTQYEYSEKNVTNGEDRLKGVIEFYKQLVIPGIYRVGGLGACTLISQKAIQSGISFSQIYNLTFAGEDRHFCIRAVALGFELFVDTHYPAFHIYREQDIKKGTEFNKYYSIKENSSKISSRPKITLSMVVKNEVNRYLQLALEKHKYLIDEAVIIDDGSTDQTVSMIENILSHIPVKIVRNEISKFSTESLLRKQQWEETINTNPEWILNLDADEVFENDTTDLIQLINQHPHTDTICFRLYDFWNETKYREDQYWNSHSVFRPFLHRYNPNNTYTWTSLPQHCHRFPREVYKMQYVYSTLRIKHLGWSKKEDRIAKYARYQDLDPEAKYGVKGQYDSILDESPNLVDWIENA